MGATGGDDRAAEKLGFPFTATRNTVRIGGGDATTDAAGVANALFPATGESDRPTAVVLVDKQRLAVGGGRVGARGPAHRRADPAGRRQTPCPPPRRTLSAG